MTLSTPCKSVIRPPIKNVHPHKSKSHICHSSKPPNTPPNTTDKELGLGLKSVWYGAEVLGNLLSAARPQQSSSPSSSASTTTPTPTSKITKSEAIDMIRQHYDQNYFVAGGIDLSDCYATDCEFADPFASFKGTERFIRNVSNLGGMLSDVEIELLDWKILDDGNLQTKWRFSGMLSGLPWKPRLAAAGGTLHVFDSNTNYVVRHYESWDVKPEVVVKNLLKPSAKIPRNNYDVLFNSISDGDVKGIWLASSTNVAKLCTAVLVFSMGSSLVTGQGVGVWPLALAGLVFSLVTEALKFSGGLQGGETGTGGRF